MGFFSLRAQAPQSTYIFRLYWHFHFPPWFPLTCLYQAFNYIDSDGEHVISKEDFTKEATTEVLDYWLGPSEDWEEDFDNIDLTNKKGEGNVLFRVSSSANISVINNLFQEFFDWAIHKNIDHQGDMGVNLE